VADPVFYQAANAYAGSWTYGATDNLLLDEIARDIVQYTKLDQ